LIAQFHQLAVGSDVFHPVAHFSRLLESNRQTGDKTMNLERRLRARKSSTLDFGASRKRIMKALAALDSNGIAVIPVKLHATI
jgi:hypothetical protein